MYEEYLMHYGRLGMKWGQHIFGRDRSSSARSKKTKKISLRQRRANYIAIKRQKEINERKNKILSDPKQLYKHRNELSDKEISDAIKRFQLESQLKQLSSSSVSKGQKFIDGYSKAMNNATKVITTTKNLNKATGGLLFGFIDNKLKTNPTYKQIKDEIDSILKEVNDKDINRNAEKEAAKELAKEKLKKKNGN